MDHAINVAGNAVIHVGAKQQRQTPSIPVTPFLKKTFLDVNSYLLLFNSEVNTQAESIDKELPSLFFDKILELTKRLEIMVRGDYNPQLVSYITAQIAAYSFVLHLHYGEELTNPNG